MSTPFNEELPVHHYMNDWLFHFNVNTQLWNAIPKHLITEYWNSYELTNILRAKHLNVLLDLLHRTKGDAEMIKEIAPDELK